MDVLRSALLAALASLACASCKPDLDQRATRISATRILAVRADPAEVEPRDDVTFTALVVDASGDATRAPAPAPAWAFCTARKPLAELGPVSPACYQRGATSFVGLGAGPRVSGTMPASACRDFGPEVPQAKRGEPYGRPVDPDPTGGYYQPLSLFIDDVTAVDTTRVACGVAGASSEDVLSFRQRYHANANPSIAAVRVDGARVAPDGVVRVAPGSRPALVVEWPACPAIDACGDGICGPDESRVDCPADCAKPVGCAGAERYLGFDADARRLVVRREEMRVSWFSSGGLFDRDRTGRAEDDPVDASDDAWSAPDQPALVHAWIVLRDARGGVTWQGLVFDVR